MRGVRAAHHRVAQRSTVNHPLNCPGLPQDGISYCEIGDRLVFLDLFADHYFGLSKRSEAAVRRQMICDDDGTSETRNDHPTAQSLRLASGRECLRCPMLQNVSHSLLDETHARANVSGAFGLAARMALASIRLRTSGLAASIASIARRKRCLLSTGSLAGATRQARAVRSCGRLFEFQSRCLILSLAVAHRMIDFGLPPQFVLGVRLSPFEAHAWVQWEDTLVNDRVQVVARFTPILVL